MGERIDIECTYLHWRDITTVRLHHRRVRRDDQNAESLLNSFATFGYMSELSPFVVYNEFDEVKNREAFYLVDGGRRLKTIARLAASGQGAWAELEVKCVVLSKMEAFECVLVHEVAEQSKLPMCDAEVLRMVRVRLGLPETPVGREPEEWVRRVLVSRDNHVLGNPPGDERYAILANIAARASSLVFDVMATLTIPRLDAIPESLLSLEEADQLLALRRMQRWLHADRSKRCSRASGVPLTHDEIKTEFAAILVAMAADSSEEVPDSEDFCAGPQDEAFSGQMDVPAAAARGEESSRSLRRVRGSRTSACIPREAVSTGSPHVPEVTPGVRQRCRQCHMLKRGNIRTTTRCRTCHDDGIANIYLCEHRGCFADYHALASLSISL